MSFRDRVTPVEMRLPPIPHPTEEQQPSLEMNTIASKLAVALNTRPAIHFIFAPVSIDPVIDLSEPLRYSPIS